MAPVKRQLSIQGALEWAFNTECAQLEKPGEVEKVRPGVSTEYMLMQRAKLGGVKVDTSKGRSNSHDDADALAITCALLPNELGGFGQASHVCLLARSGVMPDWMPGARPRLVPREWNTKGRYGTFGKTEVIASYNERTQVPHPKNPRIKLTRSRKVEIEWTPCRWDPSPDEITHERADYIVWWDALDWIRREASKVALRSIEILPAMPPYQPWR